MLRVVSEQISPRFPDRLARVRTRLEEAGLDTVVLSSTQNVAYVSGFAGSAGMAVVTGGAAHLVLDFRYAEQAAAQAPGLANVRATGPLVDAAGELIRNLGAKRVGIEEESLPVGSFLKLQAALNSTEVVPVEGLDRIRWHKSADEVGSIRKAAAIADEAFAAILPLVRPGAVERDIAAELEYQLRRRGSARTPFDIIVASGPRAALPHGVASERVIGEGEFVTLDFGAVVDGYNSDCTRTVVTAPAAPRHREVYDVVLSAQLAALAGIRPGMTGRDADLLARDVVARAGFADAFGHGLGHGIGLAVHEGPRLSPRADAVLAPGMVVTVEPGAYFPGWGGVRIEDLVVITEEGCEILTGLPKELHEVMA